jgi:hypothetical protein
VKDPQPVSPRQYGDDTIRVHANDALMDDWASARRAMRTDKLVGQMKDLQERTMRWQKNWRKARPYCNSLRRHYLKADNPEFTLLFDFLENNEQEIKALSTEINALLDHLTNDRNHLQLITDDLQTGIRNARMLPIATLFGLPAHGATSPDHSKTSSWAEGKETKWTVGPRTDEGSSDPPAAQRRSMASNRLKSAWLQKPRHHSTLRGQREATWC